jgi:hypothetical protein
MILHREPTIGLLDLVVGGSAVYEENCVKVGHGAMKDNANGKDVRRELSDKCNYQINCCSLTVAVV